MQLRKVTTVLGVLFILQGLGFLLIPEQATSSLGMPLLDGIGRSTQLGDFAAFFVGLGISALLGSRPGNGRLLYVSSAVLGLAALGRTLAWMLQGASFAPIFIFVEVLGCLVFLVAARQNNA